VPNAVDAELFAEAPRGDRARQRYGLEGRRVIGYLGSFQPWHHLGGLLSAFASLVRDDPSLHLFLVGDGPARGATAERASALGVADSVTFAGHVHHSDAPGVMGAMDIAVVPYAEADDFYFSPLKLFECMAAGCPTVAAAIGQIGEVVEHGRTGWLYPAGDDAALAGALELLLGDPERARAIGAAGRAEVLSSYSWDAVAYRVENMARQLAEVAVS
jgi:glycosyltransferase involved in cell wall biosynthesis